MAKIGKMALVDVLVEKCDGLKKRQAEEVVDILFDTIIEKCAGGDTVTIVGFGSFGTHERSARDGRNPITGEKMSIPAKRCPRFHAGTEFRHAVAVAK